MALNVIQGLVLFLVTFIILVGAAYVISGTYKQQLQAMNQTQAAAKVDEATNVLSQVVSWLPVVAVIIIAMAIIGLVGGLGLRRRK